MPRLKRQELRMNPPTAVELFAGAGGLMLGLERAGFHSLVANEVHGDPCKTLRRNFPHVPVVQASIRDLDGKGLFRSAGYARPQEVTLVAGGPPCQGFSTAGLKDPIDPRNSLIGDFIRIVRDLRPHFFLLENVTGLMSMHSGRLFANVLHELSTIGYDFHHEVLFAADYGVPQMRKRLIVLGSRSGRPPMHPVPTHRAGGTATLLNRDRRPTPTCGEAIGDLPLINPGEVATTYARPPHTDYQRLMRSDATVLHNHQASRHRQQTMDYYHYVPPGGTSLDIPEHVRNGKQGVQRWPLDGIARTITTEPTDFLHPTQDRIPTIRELARIQSFPDAFVFMGQRTTGNKMRRLGYCSQSQQVGNAVPPLLAEAIGRSLIEGLGEVAAKEMRVEAPIPVEGVLSHFG